MKIIVAPSKTQKIRRLEKISDYEVEIPLNQLEMMKKQRIKTNKLVKIINSSGKEIIAQKMKLKGELLNEVVEDFKNFKKNDSGHGILSYTGTVFKELRIKDFCEEEFSYINEHIMILSALYGPLPAFYLIKPYRLDMTMSFFEQSLYKEWQKECKNWFEVEDLIIDLASKEFSKMVVGHKLTFEFLQNVKGQYKTVAYHSKQGRGFMLNYLISHKITNIEDIKAIDIEGYRYDENRSTSDHYVFIRY